MSEIKQKVKVKREHDGGQRSPPLSSPKGSSALKSSKDVKKDPHVKKELESPVKKEPMPAKPIKVRKDAENIKPPKREPPSANKSVVSKVQTVKKEEVVSISKASSSKDVSKKSKGSKEEPEKKERKVYSLPGQKHDPPDERDPLRIFYESLYKENPKSEMAEVWMMEHGLLGPEVAKKAFERKKKNQLNQKLSSPAKISKEVVKKSEKTSSKKVVLKSDKNASSSNGDSKLSKLKRKLDSDDDDDFILKPKKKLNTNS